MLWQGMPFHIIIHGKFIFCQNFPRIIPANLQKSLKIFLGVHQGPRRIGEDKKTVHKSHAAVPQGKISKIFQKLLRK